MCIRDRAEDVAQEAWLAALRRPPGRQGDPRPWLARVVRNAARTLARGEEPRRARERAAARSEALPPTGELAAEVELQRAVAAEVLALDEPYREAVILRYFHDLSPTAIAERQGSR